MDLTQHCAYISESFTSDQKEILGFLVGAFGLYLFWRIGRVIGGLTLLYSILRILFLIILFWYVAVVDGSNRNKFKEKLRMTWKLCLGRIWGISESPPETSSMTTAPNSSACTAGNRKFKFLVD